MDPWRTHGYATGRKLHDGRWMAVYTTLTGNGRLVVCDAWGSITMGFCYDSERKAVQAMEAWNGEGEPAGWFRDVLTGRRRPDGKPGLEYIQP